MRGCFDRTLREMDCAALFNHSPDQVLGRKSAGTLRLGVTELGLQYQITPPETQLGRDLATSIKRGDITGSSFSFIPRKYRNIPQMNGKMIRELHDVDLYDVGPVTFPAYASTTAGVRAMGDLAELRKQIQSERVEILVDAFGARARTTELAALYSF
jgi:HK97 family phage prohead protease